MSDSLVATPKASKATVEEVRGQSIGSNSFNLVSFNFLSKAGESFRFITNFYSIVL